MLRYDYKINLIKEMLAETIKKVYSKNDLTENEMREYASLNECFRNVIYTGRERQVALMCLWPLDVIPFEVHNNNDQLLEIVEGTADISTKDERITKISGEKYNVVHGTGHVVFNGGVGTMLRLYTIYTPPNHNPGTVQIYRSEEDTIELMKKYYEPYGKVSYTSKKIPGPTMDIVDLIDSKEELENIILRYKYNLPIYIATDKAKTDLGGLVVSFFDNLLPKDFEAKHLYCTMELNLIRKELSHKIDKTQLKKKYTRLLKLEKIYDASQRMVDVDL